MTKDVNTIDKAHLHFFLNLARSKSQAFFAIQAKSVSNRYAMIAIWVLAHVLIHKLMSPNHMYR